MKTILGVVACALMVGGPTLAVGASPNYGCDSVNFSQEVLAKLPNAKVLCRGVMEKNGSVYVKYTGRVVSSSAESTTVEFLDKDGKAVSRATFKPAAGQMASMEGKKVKYSDLKKGDELHFYIAHNRWGLYATPDDSVMTIVSVEQL